ncbi:hypothetical protein R1sor_006123 [Riccia sorocarpa]|uniref:Protein root UVB sensitive 1, chloroplastic n=1 Tax=Riccia sorocarpa TaxID=122646 RepID=A0ABD3HQ15_9MARC
MSLTVASPSGAFLQGKPNVFTGSESSSRNGLRRGDCANVSDREWLTTRVLSNFTEAASSSRRLPGVPRVSRTGGLSNARLVRFRLSDAENIFTGRIRTSPEQAACRCGDSVASTSNSLSASNGDNDSGSRSSAQDAAGARRGEIERRRILRIRAGKESSGNRYEFGSRSLRIGLLQIARLAGAGVGSEGASGGGNDNGSGWGGFGGGGRGDEGEQFPSDDEDFNFFRGLFSLFRSRCNTGLYVWAASAFLTGFFVSALDLSPSAQAKSFSKPRMLVGGDNGGNWGNGNNEKGAAAADEDNEEELNKSITGAVWEVRGGKWTRFLVDLEEDRFLLDTVKRNEEEVQAYEHSFETAEARKKHEEEVKKKGKFSWPQGRRIDSLVREAGVHFTELVKQVFLPAGFPGSVTEDYLEFTYWRLSQIVASQVSGVLTTQALLYAVGLGKGAIPTAAAVNWVLRDGIGYLSKIMLSKYGRHFDVHPKGWRLISDLIENASYGLELLTPAFPHLFVYLAAAAGAGRSAAGLIQAATKSCFNSSFAAQRNFAEIIAKGEAQGMASKSVGIGLGILISGYVGSSGPLLVMAFGAVSALHIFFNIKSYQAVQLRTLNVYRASLVISQYLENGTVPVIKDVNAAEPILFVHLPFDDVKQKEDQILLNSLSPAAKEMASTIEKNVELGSSLAEVVTTKAEADALMDLYSREEFLLAKKGSRAMVVLKENASPRDMLRALVQLIYIYNYGKERTEASSGIEKDSSSRDGILRVTYNLMDENFDKITRALADRNWVSDGLVARPAPNRLTQGVVRITQAADVKG